LKQKNYSSKKKKGRGGEPGEGGTWEKSRALAKKQKVPVTENGPLETKKGKEGSGKGGKVEEGQLKGRTVVIAS